MKLTKKLKYWVIDKSKFQGLTVEEYNNRPIEDEEKRGFCFQMTDIHIENDRIVLVRHSDPVKDYISLDGAGRFPVNGFAVEDLHYIQFYETKEDLKKYYEIDEDEE